MVAHEYRGVACLGKAIGCVRSKTDREFASRHRVPSASIKRPFVPEGSVCSEGTKGDWSDFTLPRNSGAIRFPFGFVSNIAEGIASWHIRKVKDQVETDGIQTRSASVLKQHMASLSLLEAS